MAGKKTLSRALGAVENESAERVTTFGVETTDAPGDPAVENFIVGGRLPHARIESHSLTVRGHEVEVIVSKVARTFRAHQAPRREGPALASGETDCQRNNDHKCDESEGSPPASPP